MKKHSAKFIFALVVAIFLPPLGVAIMDGCTCNVCLNILLTLLFYIPGLVHAIIVIVDDYK